MKLTLKERYAILNLLPAEANFMTLKAIKEIQDKVSLTSDEIKKFNVRTETYINGNGTVVWDKEHNEVEFKIDFSDTAINVIETQLREYDREKKLTLNMFGVYEKFMYPHKKEKAETQT